MVGMRNFIFDRFGAGQHEVLEACVRLYLDGIPGPKTRLVFPLRCNTVDKLEALEKERKFLVDTTPHREIRAPWWEFLLF